MARKPSSLRGAIFRLHRWPIVLLAGACLSPTQVTLELQTDIPCRDLRNIYVYLPESEDAGEDVPVAHFDALQIASFPSCLTNPKGPPSGPLGTLAILPRDRSQTQTVARVTVMTTDAPVNGPVNAPETSKGLGLPGRVCAQMAISFRNQSATRETLFLPREGLGKPCLPSDAPPPSGNDGGMPNPIGTQDSGTVPDAASSDAASSDASSSDASSSDASSSDASSSDASTNPLCLPNERDTNGLNAGGTCVPYRDNILICPPGLTDSNGSAAEGTCSPAADGWTLMAEDTFEAMDERNWFVENKKGSERFSKCGSYPLLGGYDIYGRPDPAQAKYTSIQKTYATLPSHGRVKVALEVLRIDSWDGADSLIVRLQNTEIPLFKSPWDNTPDLVHLCGQPTHDWFRDGFFKNVEHTVMNSDASFKVQITSNLDQAPGDESWGLYRARVWVAP